MQPRLIPVFLAFMITTFTATAQVDSSVKKEITITQNKTDDEEKVFQKVDIEAAFPGGDEAWIKYLQKTLNPNVPVDNGAPAGTYMVIVQFVVSKDGTISDVKALTHHGYGMEQEVVRVINRGPNWLPAIQDGRQVKAYRKQPVTFQIEEDKKKKRKNKG